MTTTITTRSNPYVTTLLWIGTLGIVAAVVLAITGAMTVSQASDIYGSSIGLAKGAAFASAAGIAGFVGVVSFVGGFLQRMTTNRSLRASHVGFR